jgi:FkbM family methyltransferase
VFLGRWRKDWKTVPGRALLGLRSAVRPAASGWLSHAQFGEDMVLRGLLPDGPGFYVDIGAHHPVHFSNTYHFYCRGWHGLNVDAAPGCMAPFRSLRPRDINVEAAVGARDGELLQFHRFEQAALNTFDPELARQALARGARLLGTDQLPVRSLNALLEAYLPPRQRVDFLSVDVEGLDEAILATLDLGRFRPTVILFEWHGPFDGLEHLPTVRTLSAAGYGLVARAGPSVFMATGETQRGHP